MEASEICNFLVKEFTGPLADLVEGAGVESSSGATRRLVVEQLESLCHQVLTLALARHHDRQARPVTVYQNVSDD